MDDSTKRAAGGPGAGGPRGDRTGAAGLAQGAFCYLIWGAMPIYWKLLSGLPALEVLAWRMVWACVFVVVLCVAVRRIRFLYLIHERRAVKTFVVSGILVSLNWGIYVWAVNAGHLLETSLGYYLCPLASIFCGVVFFRERLTPIQKAATALAGAGVAFFMATSGGVTWIPFALAVSFSIYGAVKKKGGYPALPGMALESLITGALGLILLVAGLGIPALWSLTPPVPDASAVSGGPPLFALLVGCGILTAAPLLLFSAAANRISLSMLGFLQYIAPSMGLLLAVFVYGEPLTPSHAVCFGLIWTGIVAVSLEPLVRRARRAKEGKAG